MRSGRGKGVGGETEVRGASCKLQAMGAEIGAEGRLVEGAAGEESRHCEEQRRPCAQGDEAISKTIANVWRLLRPGSPKARRASQ